MKRAKVVNLGDEELSFKNCKERTDLYWKQPFYYVVVVTKYMPDFGLKRYDIMAVYDRNDSLNNMETLPDGKVLWVGVTHFSKLIPLIAEMAKKKCLEHSDLSDKEKDESAGHVAGEYYYIALVADNYVAISPGKDKNDKTVYMRLYGR